MRIYVVEESPLAFISTRLLVLRKYLERDFCVYGSIRKGKAMLGFMLRLLPYDWLGWVLAEVSELGKFRGG
jgi:hypothetical protein